MDDLGRLESAMRSVGRAADVGRDRMQQAGHAMAPTCEAMHRSGFSPIYLERWFFAHGGVVPLDWADEA